MQLGEGGEVIFKTGEEAEALRAMLETGRDRRDITRPIGAEIALDDLHSPRTIKAIDTPDTPYQLPVDEVTAAYIFRIAAELSNEFALFPNKDVNSAKFLLERREEALSELNEASIVDLENEQAGQLECRATV